jgi:hypothetical protein
MNRSRSPLLLLLSSLWLLTSIQAMARDDIKDTVKRSFKVNEGGVLRIDVDQGNIEVMVTNDRAVYVEMERTLNVSSEAEARRILEEHHQFEMRQEGNGVRIISRYETDRSSWWRRRDNQFHVRFVIHVPARFNIDFSTGAGNVAVAGVQGKVEGDTGAGNIKLGRVQGPVEISTGSGNVDLEGASGTIQVDTGAGNITLLNVQGNVEASTGAGNIIAHILRQPDGNSTLESGAGNVTVYLADQVRLTVDAQAALGNASCDFPLRVEGKWMTKSFAGRINGGGPTLSMSSGVGNVALLKKH